jgi:hypothetical protein
LPLFTVNSMQEKFQPIYGGVQSPSATVPQVVTLFCEVFLSNCCIFQSIIPGSEAGRSIKTG